MFRSLRRTRVCLCSMVLHPGRMSAPWRTMTAPVKAAPTCPPHLERRLYAARRDDDNGWPQELPRGTTLMRGIRFLTALIAIAAGCTWTNAMAETVLITGANQGIGLEFAREYAARGWTVIATHRRTTTPQTLAALAAKYPKVRIERMDVTDAAQIQALGAKLKGVPIDLLLSNAGLVRTDPLDKPGGNTNQIFGTLDFKLLDEFIHTNVAGPLMISETFINNVKASRQKKIVAISSAAASVTVPPFMPNGSPVPDHYWYRISKAALNSAMHLLSATVKPDGIT